jgi:protein required for attachment to host cells
MKKEILILIANSTQARIFKKEGNHAIKEVEALINPANRMHARDLYSDKRGTTFQSVGTGRSALEQRVDPKEQEVIDFSKEVCHFLESERNKGNLQRVYIAASPAFLGHLRQSLSPSLLQLVEAEIDKDITHLKAHEIEEYLAL